MPTPSQHAFSEKVALVAGGSTPVGRAVAMQLALYGCFVIAVSEKGGEEERRALGELKSLGTLAHTFETDLRDPDGISVLVEEIDSLYGRLDLLVNCVKSPDHSDFIGTDESGLEMTFDRPFRSAFFLTQAVLPLMEARPRPSIVNVVTACETADEGTDIAFSAANAAVLEMTESLLATLPGNIRINSIALNGRSSNMANNEELDPDLFRKKSGVDPDDVARVVVYLLSSEAKALNGQILRVG